jgi:hypothetical protein
LILDFVFWILDFGFWIFKMQHITLSHVQLKK